MKASNIIIGQNVSDEKVTAAKQLRRHMTPAEEMLWKRLRRNQIDGVHFRRQQIISGFVVDFYCHRFGLVIEVDGGIHKDFFEADRERQHVLEGLGLTVIRFQNEEIFENMVGVLKAIRENLTPRPPSLRGKGESE